jgi:hypothetical protein
MKITVIENGFYGGSRCHRSCQKGGITRSLDEASTKVVMVLGYIKNIVTVVRI